MDEPTTRALLAQMEVTARLMREMVDQELISPSWAAGVANDAADRLDPVSDGVYLPSLSNMWKTTAKLLAHPPEK